MCLPTSTIPNYAESGLRYKETHAAVVVYSEYVDDVAEFTDK